MLIMNQFNFFFDNFCFSGRKIAEVGRDGDKLSPPTPINSIENNSQKIQINIIFFASKIFSAPADLSYPLFLTLFHDNTALNLIR